MEVRTRNAGERAGESERRRPSNSDLELARLCAAGDERAWETFVRDYRPVLYRVVLPWQRWWKMDPARRRTARELWILGAVAFLFTMGNFSPVAPWAQKRGHSIILIPRFDGHAVADREMIEFFHWIVDLPQDADELQASSAGPGYHTEAGENHAVEPLAGRAERAPTEAGVR